MFFIEMPLRLRSILVYFWDNIFLVKLQLLTCELIHIVHYLNIFLLAAKFWSYLHVILPIQITLHPNQIHKKEKQFFRRREEEKKVLYLSS
jgi:hypothetical protein